MSEGKPVDHEQEANREAFDRNAQARSQGLAFGVPKEQGETDDDYRSRLSGVLRASGRIIEAHEVYTGRRFDDPEQGPMGSMLGITGAMAQALQGVKFSYRDPESQVGDDMAAGIIVSEGRDSTQTYIGRVFDALGPSVGMDLLLGSQERKPRE